MFVRFSHIAVWCRYFVNIVHLCVGVCVNSGSFNFERVKSTVFITWYWWPWSVPYYPASVWCATSPLLCNRSDAGGDCARLVYFTLGFAWLSMFCQMRCVSLHVISVHLKTCKICSCTVVEQPKNPWFLTIYFFIFTFFGLMCNWSAL